MLRTKTLGFACLLLIPAVMTASVFAQSNESRLFQTERDAIAESVLVAEMQLTELESVYGKSHPKVKAIEGALAYLQEKQRKLAEADYDAWANQRLTPMLDEITEEFGKLQLDDSQQEGVDLAFQQLDMIMQQVYERETEQARASLEQIRENARLKNLQMERDRLETISLATNIPAEVTAAAKQAAEQQRRAELELQKARTLRAQALAASESELATRVSHVETELIEIKTLLQQLVEQTQAEPSDAVDQGNES